MMQCEASGKQVSRREHRVMGRFDRNAPSDSIQRRAAAFRSRTNTCVAVRVISPSHCWNSAPCLG